MKYAEKEGMKGLIVSLKTQLKRNNLFRKFYNLLLPLNNFCQFKLIFAIKQYYWFIKSFSQYKKMDLNSKFETIEFYPCLSDNLTYTPLEPTYFFQDCWAASKIFELKPAHHYDVGSSAKTMGLLSQFVPITMIDIRPIELELENLHFIRGSILELPFEDNSIESLSSLCVVEHIGLGRYGDPIDQFGSEKAISELKRVVKIGGVLLFSVPVDKENKTYFNAHRAFTREYVMELFCNFELIEEKYHYGTKTYSCYSENMGFGTGLYMFRKSIPVMNSNGL